MINAARVSPHAANVLYFQPFWYRKRWKTKKERKVFASGAAPRENWGEQSPPPIRVHFSESSKNVEKNLGV